MTNKTIDNGAVFLDPKIANAINREKQELPDTIMTYCRRHGELKGYAVQEGGSLICRADYFKDERPDELKNVRCLYQENKDGRVVCGNGDIRRHYDRVNLEKTREEEYLRGKNEIFNIRRD